MPTKYYELRTSWDPKIIGVTNGVMQVEISKQGFEDKRLFDRIEDFFFNGGADRGSTDEETKFEVESEKIELPCVKPLKKAKITSILSYGPSLKYCRFLLSDDVRKCLERFEVQTHRLYKANVFQKEQILKYWVFYMYPLNYEVIDFKDSLFYAGPLTDKKYYSVSDLSEYLTLDKEVNLSPVIISLNESFDKSLDLFSLRAVGMFASERFKAEFEKNGFTGMEFIPAFSDYPNATIIKTR